MFACGPWREAAAIPLRAYTTQRSRRGVARCPVSVQREYPSGFGEFLFEAFGFVVAGEAVDQCTEFAFHHVGELVKRKTDAVIGDTVLREVVGADFFGAVAGFDLAAAFGAECGLLLFQF